ncbi:MAG: type II toxin-antitoxin system prevent-host-death family antitoxin [Gammaproteobacteria bacterium]
MQIWQLQQAKARLSELIRICTKEGPQSLSVRGKEEAVLLSKADFDKLTEAKPKFVDFMRASPLVGVRLDLRRDQSPEREIDL